MVDLNKTNNEVRERDSLIRQKHAALTLIMGAWDDALVEGLEPDLIANAALFAAFSELVATYGEEAAARLAEGLPRRVRHGEFSVHRTNQ